MFCRILVYHLRECPCYSRLYFETISLNKSLLGTLTTIEVVQNKIVKRYRVYYMPARGYEFYLRVVNSISHSFAALTREISS